MKIFGTVTALVTPFNQDGSVDYGALKNLVAEQIAGGVEAVCSVGTSGESPTLSREEHLDVIAKTAEFANGKLKIVAGTGANATSEAIDLTKDAISLGGVDASLQVTPYYNKPNQEGLYRHFSTIADLGLPVILYNVPGRTGREIALDTVVRLAKNVNVIAIKEASGSVDRVNAIKSVLPDFTVLAGDDALALPMIAAGAEGAVSVASNLIPREMSEMVRLAMKGEIDKALKYHRTYYKLFRDLFIDVNPVMAKEALSMMNKLKCVFRLPLCETTEANRAKLRQTLAELKLV